ncbi:MAG TPA: hypothetical protein VHN79_02905, partial [Lacunisphaera sp.]|nr:hypothetical protein [Lacunisphaera sp.]
VEFAFEAQQVLVAGKYLVGDDHGLWGTATGAETEARFESGQRLGTDTGWVHADRSRATRQADGFQQENGRAEDHWLGYGFLSFPLGGSGKASGGGIAEGPFQA